MRRKLIYLFLLFLTAIPYFGQAQQASEFLIGTENPVGISGFIGPLIEFSSLENEFVTSGGLGIGLLLDQTFYIGFYGLGTVKSLEKSLQGYPQVDMAFGHGGLLLGYLHQSHKLVHLGLSMKIGGGGVYLAERHRHEYIFEEENKIDEDALFVLTPQVEMELNVAPWMKINLGLGYRFVSGLDTPYLNQRDLTSTVGSLGFYFGWFRSRRNG
ncbi:hypothetical protein WJR50_30025 [Catalinimonas sp. 4WD22]|uniref:hypothetical protein n=1 Tax=Catalinimonas locisalis TaxID=3133978 RepID=UPI003100CFC6